MEFLPRRALIVGLAGAVAGCTNPARNGPEMDESGSGSPTANPETVTEADESTPEYVACEYRQTPDVETEIGDWDREPPTDPTREQVAEYVRGFEQYAVYTTGEVTDSAVAIRDIEVTAVESGFVAHVAVDGGYVDFATESGRAHADLAPYTASYLVTERTVYRVEGNDGPYDMREPPAGSLVYCQPER